jgi:hypothetical protein
MANPISQVFGDYAVVAEAEGDSELEETMRRIHLLLERVANAVHKAHRVLPRRLLVEANAPVEPAWFRLFLPTEFLSQRLGMPVKAFKTICRSNPGRQTC